MSEKIFSTLRWSFFNSVMASMTCSPYLPVPIYKILIGTISGMGPIGQARRAVMAAGGRALRAQVGRLETVAQPPDAIDVRPAAGVYAVSAHAGQALVIGRERQLRIAQLGEIGAQQGRAQLGVIHRIVQVDPPVQQAGPSPRCRVGLDLHQAHSARTGAGGLLPAALPVGDSEHEVRVQVVVPRR